MQHAVDLVAVHCDASRMLPRFTSSQCFYLDFLCDHSRDGGQLRRRLGVYRKMKETRKSFEKYFLNFLEFKNNIFEKIRKILHSGQKTKIRRLAGSIDR